MARLTEHMDYDLPENMPDGSALPIGQTDDHGDTISCAHYCQKVVNGCCECNIQKCFDKLAWYEDLQEENRLVILQCAPGTTVYKPNKKTGEIDVEYLGGISRILELSGHFGDSVFLTEKEAETKLKEMGKNVD